MRIIVIGAGILGASTAYHLARAGADVVVIDAAHEGRATAAGAGIVCPWVSGVEDEPFYRLYAGGARYYRELIPSLAELGETDHGYANVGAMVVSDDSGELAAFRDMLRRRAEDAPEMGALSLLATHEARALFPPLRADLAALHVAGGARVDGQRIAACLLRGAQRLGASVRQGEAALITSGARVTGVRLNGEAIAADCVIVCAGAWAASLLRPLMTLPIEPQRGQIVHLRLPGQDTSRWPVVLPPGSHYLLAFDDARVVAGATREIGAGFDYRVTAAGQLEVLSEALHIAPGLASATIIETRVGFRPVGPGVRPMLGALPGCDGLLIGNGLGAAGLTIGPFAGRLLADTALGNPTALELSLFAPLRDARQTTMPALR